MSDFSNIVFSGWNPAGRTLVEASAGTGKTYNIQNVYLRLVLGGLAVRQILVVTFTDAATGELRDRLRAVLVAARDAIAGRTVAAKESERAERALDLARGTGTTDTELSRRLRAALMDFDSAPVQTIHGFCNSVLERYAFECGHDPDAELLTETSRIVRETCLDWWRRNAYAPDGEPEAQPFDDVGRICKLVTEALRAPDSLVTASGKSPDLARYQEQARIVGEIVCDVRRRLRDRAAMTYDSMLLNVREVLRDPAAGPRLRDVLRREFRAALIDEFQDTDPVQYEIFRVLFGKDTAPGDEPPLLFVGDPKQSIYGFRGGDIFTYYAAKADVPSDTRHSLGTNYRSEKALVDAINALFKDGADFRVFRNENIDSPGNLDAQGTVPEKTLLVDSKPDPAPFRLWTYEVEKDGSIATGGETDLRIKEDCAREIVRLLNDGTQLLGGRRITPRDIAILVRVHDDAADMQEVLKRHGVHSVRQDESSVLTSPYAGPFAALMQAMLTPGRPSALRNALAAEFMPCSDADLARFHDAEEEEAAAAASSAFATSPTAPATMEEWSQVLGEAGRRWREHSFMDAFFYLSDRLDLPAHVLALPDGLRRITDLRHLADLVHGAARELRLSPAALRRHFLDRISDSRDESEEDKIRLADDGDAVRIMTVFHSKGLEFPIVFVPTLWRMKSEARHQGSPVTRYHDADKRLVLDLTADKIDSAVTAAAKRESMEENIRLVYVALTRAANRVYCAELWKPEGRSRCAKETHALTLILDHWRAQNGIPAPSGRTDPGTPPAVHGSILACNPPPDLPDARYKPSAPTSLVPSLEPPLVDKTHGHASFSSLTYAAGGISVVALPAPLDSPRDVDQSDSDAPDSDAALGDATPDPIFSIPGGAKLGTCWHEIFEVIDFAAPAADIDAEIDLRLDRHRVCPNPPPVVPDEIRRMALERRQSVHEMVRRVLKTPLAGFRLRDIPRAARRSELEFDFSLDCGCPVGDMADLLSVHWGAAPWQKEFIDSLRARTNRIPDGFMTGAIDLVFRHAGKFYIVDWKSNQIGRTPESFEAAGLHAEMAAHGYYLQYLIYTVALHGFLARRLANYDYDAHFGGIYYLFLRGMDGASSRGVFHDRPSRALVEALSRFLGGCTP